MIVGSKQLTQCCPSTTSQDRPSPPPGDVSTMKMKVQVKTSFNFADAPKPGFEQHFRGYPAVVYPDTTYGYQSRVQNIAMSGYYQYDKISYSANGVTEFEITWTRTTDSLASGNQGKYMRPGTDKIIATNLTWVSTVLVFSSPTVIASYNTYQETELSPIQNFPNPCEAGEYFDYFKQLSTGDTVDRSANFPLGNPGVIGNQSVKWLGIADSDQPGLGLYQTAPGAALAPWTISVQSGTVSFTDKNNNTTSFNGTISSVVSAINSWPSSGGKYFEADPQKSTSEAKTSDLKDFTSSPGFITGAGYCVLYLPIVSIGDKLTPSSTGVQFGNVGSYANPNLVFDPDKFPDNEDGFNSFIKSTFYPKLQDFYFTIGNGTLLPHFFQTGEFDVFLSGGSYYWSLTSGASTATYDVPILAASKQEWNYTLISATCAPPRQYPTDPIECGEPEGNCNIVSPLREYSCNGFHYPDCVGTDERPYVGRCFCENFEAVLTELPYFTVPATQTATGGWSIS